jgi:uncharacterized membrane protein YhaH (DUF805 family)
VLNLVVDPLVNYINLNGRASRLQFWAFCLFVVLGITAFGQIIEVEKLAELVLLFSITPTIALSIRRVNDGQDLHTVGYFVVGGMWTASIVYYLIIIGVLKGLPAQEISTANGFLMMGSLFFLLRPSQKSENLHGPNPNEVSP